MTIMQCMSQTDGHVLALIGGICVGLLIVSVFWR